MRLTYGAIALLVCLWLPIRLVQEAIPEWRLVSWAMALVVVGLTLLLIRASEASSLRSPLTSDLRPLTSLFASPLLFFLVAVPWPTVIEAPLIRALTRANAAVTIELVNLLGIPAIQHGNLIEVGSGVVGIDEACSGIRSFQATLMISLFFGELYRLAVLRRTLLVVLGFVLAFVFNVGRTGLLTWVASNQGVSSIDKWHDPAGVTILLGCFFALLLLSWGLRTERTSADISESDLTHRFPTWFGLSPRVGIAALLGRIPLALGWGLLVWILCCEVAAAGWYQIRESSLPPSAEWTVNWPKDAFGFKEFTLSEKTKRLLRYDAGTQYGWTDSDGNVWQAFYFEWRAGRTAGYLAKRHTPEACLPATGHRLMGCSDARVLTFGSIALPYRMYRFQNEAQTTVHVFRSRWEAGVIPESIVTEDSTAFHLLRGVWAGRGRLGQKVIELAVWGIEDEAAAETAVRRQLEKLIQVQP